MSGNDVEFFRSLEGALHRPDVRRSSQAVEALLADNFVEFGSSGGIYDKATVVEALAREPQGASSPLPDVLDFAVQVLGPDAVLVTYRSIRHAVGQTPARTVLRSSVWTQIGGNWQMLFHQGTVVPPP